MIDAQEAQATKIFLGNKLAAGICNQFWIRCNDTLMVDNLDFMCELNIR
jgi:hypothetical protein